MCPGSGELAFAETAVTEEFSQLQQSVAALSGGGFGVVWHEGLWPDRRVRMQWLNRHGHPLHPLGGRLLGARSVDYGDEVIVPDATAGAYVAFVAGREVVVQRFDANGEPLWPGEGIVASDVTPSQTTFTPHLVPNPGSGVFACFHFNDVGPIIDIRCQSFDAAGTRLWSSAGVSVGTGTDSELRVVPRGLSDGTGGLMLFWRNQRNPFAPQDPGPVLMEGQRFAPDGQKLWGALPKVVRTTNLASSNGYTYNFFQVVSDGSGGAVLAFNDWTGTSDFALDVMAQRVSVAGDLLWGAGAVVTGANGHQQHDQTIATRDGGAFVVVYEEISSSQNRLLLFRLGPGG